MSGDTKWLPLESNPEIMTKFLQNLGLPSDWAFVDVLGLDPDLLAMVPKPVSAVLLLFPMGPKHEEYFKEKEIEIREKGQELSENLYFMHQTIKNACGTVALIHSVANSQDCIKLRSDSFLKEFLTSTAKFTPEERGQHLEGDKNIEKAHEEFAHEGQTETPNLEDEVNTHFISLVKVDGHIYELDGRKKFPINHGPTTEDTFLLDASRVCKEYIERDPENLNFTVVALAAAEN